MHTSQVRLFVEEVLLYLGNNRDQHRAPRPVSVSFKQIEIARTNDGARRLFRAELNGAVTGFVEKHFKGEILEREFALGGRINGIDEAMAKARFTGVDIKPTPHKKPPVVRHSLPDFLTKPEPVMRGKSAKSKPSTPPPPPKKAVATEGNFTPVRGPRSRKDALALASGLSAIKR